MNLIKIASFFLLTAIISCNNNDRSEDENSIAMPIIAAPQVISYSVIAQYPKDTSAYTQGLEIYKGKLYEGTGDYQNSSLRIVNWKTGNVEKKHVMGTDLIFGEGITILKGQLYQLTWQSNIVYIYDINNIDKPVKTLKWPHEGWGITNNGTDLIISDGSDAIYFADPATLEIKNTIRVKSHKGSINAINELEYIDGFIYANVYEENYIIKIDPSTGNITGIIHLDNLLQPSDVIPGYTNVLNGIAYDSTSGSILVTGKRWPKLFELKLN